MGLDALGARYSGWAVPRPGPRGLTVAPAAAAAAAAADFPSRAQARESPHRYAAWRTAVVRPGSGGPRYRGQLAMALSRARGWWASRQGRSQIRSCAFHFWQAHRGYFGGGKALLGDLGQIKICPFEAGTGRDLPTWRLSNATLIHNPSQQREFPSAAKMAARVLCGRKLSVRLIFSGSVSGVHRRLFEIRHWVLIVCLM